jgi:hypothetical protein
LLRSGVRYTGGIPQEVTMDTELLKKWTEAPEPITPWLGNPFGPPPYARETIVERI